MKVWLLIAALVGLLVLAVIGAAIAWTHLGDVQLSGHGLIALGLGIFLSLGLGFGLMALVFYSNRHGHDDHSDSA